MNDYLQFFWGIDHIELDAGEDVDTVVTVTENIGTVFIVTRGGLFVGEFVDVNTIVALNIDLNQLLCT